MAEFDSKKFSFLHQDIDRSKARDTGLAATLVFLLLGLYFDQEDYFIIATVVLLVTMIFPGIFKPLGYLWFGLAYLLGTIASKVILAIVYILLVLPVGLLRKALGKDSLRLKAWKKSEESAFIVRNHTYVSADIDKPY